MGNTDSRCSFDGGYFHLGTTKPMYMPGETVTGQISIRTTVCLPARHIMLEIKGKEKVRWKEMHHREDGQREDKIWKQEKKIMH
jgi:hypothetical protein